MRLQWSEIRARAAAFSERHKAAHYEKGETHTFYNEFFQCFGVDRKQVATYEQRVKNLPGDKQGFIDLFMPSTLIVEQKSAGLDLRAASNQALDYFDWLPEATRPRYILTCDFQRWHLIDLETAREWRFPLADLKKHVEAFAFVVGVQPRIFRNQKPANPRASQLLGQLHEQLAEQGYSGHKLQLLLVRLLFILFADDTGIWPKDQFLVFLEQRTQPDGRDLGRWLTQLFEVLDTPEEQRQAGLEDLADFPHINGKLFEERIDTAVFDNALRDILLDASAFNWGEVSPAIFGSLFESVIDKVTRRKQGAHYTPEEAIQKVIGPLLLDDLWIEFEALKARKDGGRAKALAAFHDKLAALTFFDPACGAGNFLVVAYRELRELERALLKEIHPAENRQLVTDVSLISKLNVNQFYGIEIDEFPSQIAQVALWMTDHIANNNLGEDFGVQFARIPLVTAPNIRHGDALEMDWADVLPPGRCSYVFGNPPFWPKLFNERRLEIAFAHRTFVWPGRAGVHCVIVGLAQRGMEPKVKRLFSYPNPKGAFIETHTDWMTAYLLPIAENVRFNTVAEVSAPINDAPRLIIGSKPIDGGHYIFDASERGRLLHVEPGADEYLRPYVGSEEFLNGGQRWILALHDAAPDQLRALPTVRERIARVRRFREASRSAPTQTLAETPTRYHVNVIPDQPFLVVPKVSSERREYVPIGWLEPPTIPSDLVFVFRGASLYDFATLTSAMHMAWLRHIGGRLESRYRYSIGLVYNNFPWPNATPSQRANIEALAQAVLDARAMPKNTNSTLADLYDPDRMPAELHRAHKALDAAVDKLYSPKGFADDRARVEHLFTLYEALVMPTAVAPAANRRTNRRVGRQTARAAE